MTTALAIFAVLGALGAFDTIYYHEWRARLPALGPRARRELDLHALRDFIYSALFIGLSHASFRGALAVVVGALLLVEIGVTLADFIVEDTVRRPIGGVYPGERAAHAVMGIVYGAMLAHLVPELAAGWEAPTGLGPAPAIPEPLRWTLTLMGLGVFASGVRDALAARGVRGAAWPWGRAAGARR